MSRDNSEFPLEKLHAALPHDHHVRQRVDALHAELRSKAPRAAVIKEYAKELRKHAPIAAIIENWFEDPRTQEFINDLVQAGL